VIIYEATIAIINPATRTEQQMTTCYAVDTPVEPGEAERLAHAWGHERVTTMRGLEDNERLFLGAVLVHRWIPKRPDPSGYIGSARAPFPIHEWKYDRGTPEPA